MRLMTLLVGTGMVGLLHFCTCTGTGSGELRDNCYSPWEREYITYGRCSVIFEKRDNHWEMHMYRSPDEFIIRINNDTSCDSQTWAIRSVHCNIGTYLSEFCKYHGCKCQVHLGEKNDVWFNIYNATIYGKKIIVEDVHQLLNGKTIAVDEAYILRRWSLLLTQTKSPLVYIYEVRLIDKQNSSYDFFTIHSKEMETVSFPSLYELVKESQHDDYRAIFESERYMVLLKPVGSIERYSPLEPSERREEIAAKTQDLAELVVNYPPVKVDQNKKVPTKRLTLTDKISSILTARKPIHRNIFSTYVIQDPIDDIIPALKLLAQRIVELEKLEKNAVKHTPTCNWEGGKWIFGDRGCEDDIYIYCKNGKVHSFEQGCG